MRIFLFGLRGISPFRLNGIALRRIMVMAIVLLFIQHSATARKTIADNPSDGFLPAAYVVAGDTVAISGTVTSDSGKVLAVAGVNVKGTRINTITNAVGRFTSKVPDRKSIMCRNQ